mmetsp:Transcript_32666/g.77490  ORF Transcript_32666/g.77490 Transcript_32666/m.77490 type:complete len:247 (+) Transcript_32666:541-1281(+)
MLPSQHWLGLQPNSPSSRQGLGVSSSSVGSGVSSSSVGSGVSSSVGAGIVGVIVGSAAVGSGVAVGSEAVGAGVGEEVGPTVGSAGVVPPGVGEGDDVGRGCSVGVARGAVGIGVGVWCWVGVGVAVGCIVGSAVVGVGDGLCVGACVGDTVTGTVVGAGVVGAGVAVGSRGWIAMNAADTLSRPPDTILPASAPDGVTVLRSAAFSSVGVSSGLWDRSSAAAPATWGVAMDVPDFLPYMLPGRVE